MTPAARAQAVIDILAALAATQQPADRYLRDFFRARRYAGAKDRRAIAEQVFEVMRWLGAAYLIWLGIQAWRSAGRASALAPPAAHVHARRGFVVAMTNPKTIAFFTAFLPQFIDPTLPVAHQLVVMCICSVTLGSILDCGWAVAAGYGRSFFVKPQHNRLLGRLSALALIGGGVWLSLARRPG